MRTYQVPETVDDNIWGGKKTQWDSISHDPLYEIYWDYMNTTVSMILYGSDMNNLAQS